MTQHGFRALGMRQDFCVGMAHLQAHQAALGNISWTIQLPGQSRSSRPVFFIR